MTATAKEVPGADVNVNENANDNKNNRMAETVAYEPKTSSESGSGRL